MVADVRSPWAGAGTGEKLPGIPGWRTGISWLNRPLSENILPSSRTGQRRGGEKEEERTGRTSRAISGIPGCAGGVMNFSWVAADEWLLLPFSHLASRPSRDAVCVGTGSIVRFNTREKKLLISLLALNMLFRRFDKTVVEVRYVKL